MNKLLIIVSLVLCLSLPVSAGSFVLNDYNLVTVGDVNAASLYVHGRTFIDGNLTASSANSEFGLTVADNHAINLQITGNVVAGESVKTVDLTAQAAKNASQLTQASQSNTVLSNSAVVSDSIKNQFVIDNHLTISESAISALDNTASIFNNSPNQQIEILTNSVSNVASVIINVAGTTINYDGHFLNTSNISNKVLWNFFETTTINFNAVFFDTILAPFAQLTSFNDIDGSVSVLAISSALSGEINLPKKTVKAPVTVVVSEPTSWTLFLFIMLVLFLLNKRRQAF